jgi:flavocytochrome c
VAIALLSFRGEQREATGEEAPSERTDSGQRTDVVIVGAGISGLTAALELGRGGAHVVVLDMSSVFGGHAVMSQGGLCIVDTPVQESVGIDDSPDLAYADFIEWGEDADADWVRYYVDHSRQEIYDWVTDLGVRFESVETAPGNSVDRFHQPVGRGIGLVMPIYRACLEHPNIRFVWNSQAVQLLAEDRRVVGLLARNTRTNDEQPFRADAVILATGGFQSNLGMVREFWPAEFQFPDRILVGSGRNSVGLGHKLAQNVGADLVKMDHQWNYFTGIPDPRYPNSNRGLSAANMYGIIVNPDGRRFANLHNWAKEVMPALLGQEKATLWFVFDDAAKAEFVVSGTDWADFDKVDKLILQNPALVKTADTIAELAETTGLPSKHLAATIRRYNSFVEQGEDRDFSRFGPGRPAYSNQASPKLETAPFYAMQAFPLTRKSMGGVAIDRNCRVLDKQEAPIAGLYAVGELTGLAGINGKAALEGTFLGPCIVTGRVAARAVLNTISVREDTAAQDHRCTSCHDLAARLSKPRPGYWHFEKTHAVARERGTDCRVCHAELTPYREDDHRIDQQVLMTACVQCHASNVRP